MLIQNDLTTPAKICKCSEESFTAACPPQPQLNSSCKLVTQLQELFLDRFADDNHLFRCICRIKKLFYPSLRCQCVIHEKKIDFAIFERRGPRTSELDACTSSANGLPSRTGIFIGRRSNTDSSTGRPCRR